MSKKNLKGKERDGDSKDQEKRVEKVRRGKGRREAPPVWLRSTAPDDAVTRPSAVGAAPGTQERESRRSAERSRFLFFFKPQVAMPLFE